MEKVKGFAHYHNAIIKPRRTEGGTVACEILESFSLRRLKKLLQKLPPKFQLLPTFQKLLPKFLDIFVQKILIVKSLSFIFRYFYNNCY